MLLIFNACFDDDSIKRERDSMDTLFSNYKSIDFRHQRAVYYVVRGPIWPNFNLHDFRHILIHQDNMSVYFIPSYTPLLYSKTGVYRGIHYFLIFALKHILWVLVRTASPRRF